MSLNPGQSLTHYEVLGPLGAGGMGEVYRARDTRLDREVAIKVLPEEMAGDEERLRRFEREAKTLASLNHSNVAGIHGVDQEGEVIFLALELVPGEDLAERLSRGALNVDEALDVCRQIAEGLEVAHESGVIHRDLKPANVRITPDGVVKLLDFGLAKPIQPGSGDGGSSSASDSFLMTEEGVVLGTPTYMSPEQARGKPVDRRTDVWAFGCVLYECLTGKRAFGGENFGDVIAAVVGQEPDWSALPPLSPRVLELLHRALTKDPRERLRDIGEARILLQRGNLEADESVGAQEVQGRSSRSALLLVGGVVLGVLIGALAFRSMSGSNASPVDTAAKDAELPAVRRFARPPELNAEGNEVPWEETFLSPDGNSIAVTTRDGLTVRSLDSLESTLIPGTEFLAGRGVFGCVGWSPDSEFLVYLEGTTLYRVTPEGRGKAPLYSSMDDSTRLRMVAWLDDGRIIFGSVGDEGVRLHSIPEAGGPITDLAVVGASMTEGHLHGISAVPGGRFIAVLHSFFGDTFTVLTEGDSGMRTLFSLPGESIPFASWVPGDYLLFSRGPGEDADEIWAVELSRDPLEVIGEPFFIQDGVKGASVSMDGSLAYVEHHPAERRLGWWSADGELELFGHAHDQAIASASISQVRDAIYYLVGGVPPMELWKHDLRRGVSVEIDMGDSTTFWAGNLADGRIAYSEIDLAAGGPTMKSYTLPATGRGEPEPWLEGGVVSVNESHAIVADLEGDGFDLYTVDLASLERSPFRIGDEGASSASISPDGEWALLTSSGALLLTRFPSGEGEWHVSAEGGWDAEFAPDGSAIYFVVGRKLYSVSLQTDPEVLLGAPELVGQAEEGTELHSLFDANSGRFLATKLTGTAERDLVLVLGWAAELADR